jgi:dethiobiotin synthetase
MTVVVVTGVGTEIGKTHTTATLALAWGQGASVLAYKPIESGVIEGVGPDEALLASFSTFHVKRPLLQLRLRAAVSPHLAARMERNPLDLQAVVDEVAWLRRETDVLVELPGGLFSPLSDTEANADLAVRLTPDAALLVAPNRLGVLHDVRAAFEAARGRGLRLDGVVLSASAEPDLSSATNAAELVVTSGLPLLADLPRASITELAASAQVVRLVGHLRCATGKAPARQ